MTEPLRIVVDEWNVVVHTEGTLGLVEKRGDREVILSFASLRTVLQFVTEVAATAEWWADEHGSK